MTQESASAAAKRPRDDWATAALESIGFQKMIEQRLAASSAMTSGR